MVFLIAFVPALAVVIVSYVTDSKSKTIIAAIIAAALGIFTGNPVFVGIDILFVGLAYYFSIVELKDRQKSKMKEEIRLQNIADMNAKREEQSGWEEQMIKEEARIAAARVTKERMRAEIVEIRAKIAQAQSEAEINEIKSKAPIWLLEILEK